MRKECKSCSGQNCALPRSARQMRNVSYHVTAACVVVACAKDHLTGARTVLNLDTPCVAVVFHYKGCHPAHAGFNPPAIQFFLRMTAICCKKAGSASLAGMGQRVNERTRAYFQELSGKVHPLGALFPSPVWSRLITFVRAVRIAQALHNAHSTDKSPCQTITARILMKKRCSSQYTRRMDEQMPVRNISCVSFLTCLLLIQRACCVKG